MSSWWETVDLDQWTMRRKWLLPIGNINISINKYIYRPCLPAGSPKSLNWWAIAPNTGANIEWNTERGTATPIFCWLSLSLFNVNFCNLKNKRNNEHKENICPSHTFIPPLVLSREVTRDRSGCYLVWFDGVALIYSRLSFGCQIFI